MKYLRPDIDKAAGFWSCSNCDRDICWDKRNLAWLHASTLKRQCQFEAAPKRSLINLVAANLDRP